eukprot:gene5371-6042_t
MAEKSDYHESEKLLADEGICKEQFEIEEPENGTSGMSTFAAMFFVVGNILGAGIVSLPYAARLASWYSIPILIIVAIVTAFCGILLALSVNQKVVGEKEDGEVTRDPYPLLAEHAVGSKARILVTVVMNIGLVMSCIVFLLLAGEILSKLVPVSIVHASYRNQLRIWFLITGSVLLPFTLLGSPKEFWGIAFLATLTSIVSAALMLSCLGIVHYNNTIVPFYQKTTAQNLFASFGTFLFGFSGIGIFPTVQSDMKNPVKFTKVVAAGFGIVSAIYIMVTLASYIVLGNLVGEDLLTTFVGLPIYHHNTAYRVMVTIAQILICGHVLSAYVLNINPVHQQFEGYIGIPTGFCWQRCLIRSVSMMLILAFSMLVTNFGPALSLLGGTLNTMMCVIFPIWFYVAIESKVKCGMKVFLSFIVFLALIAAAGNCFVEVKNLVKVMQGTYGKH